MRKTFLLLILYPVCLCVHSQELRKKLIIPSDLESLEYYKLEKGSNGEIKRLYYTILDTINGNYCLSIFNYKRDRYWHIYECFILDTIGNIKKPFNRDTIYLNNGNVYDYDIYGRLKEIHTYNQGKKSSFWTKIEYYPNNNILSKSEMYKNYSIHGRDSNFYETGELYYVAEYVQNRLINFIVYLDPSGNKVDLVDFSNGNGCIPFYGDCSKEGDIICFKNGRVRKRINKKLHNTN